MWRGGAIGPVVSATRPDMLAVGRRPSAGHVAVRPVMVAVRPVMVAVPRRNITSSRLSRLESNPKLKPHDRLLKWEPNHVL